MTTDKRKLLHQLLETALRLTETDIDNADQHARIADALATYGRRHFGARFGDRAHKPKTRSDLLDGDK